MSVALANSGDLQIELIQQRTDAPSMYKEFLDAGREGLQHMSYWTREYQALYDRALSLGYKVGHEGQIGGEQGRFAYFDTQAHPGTVVEISDVRAARGVSSNTSVGSPSAGMALIPSARLGRGDHARNAIVK